MWAPPNHPSCEGRQSAQELLNAAMAIVTGGHADSEIYRIAKGSVSHAQAWLSMCDQCHGTVCPQRSHCQNFTPS